MSRRIITVLTSLAGIAVTVFGAFHFWKYQKNRHVYKFFEKEPIHIISEGREAHVAPILILLHTGKSDSPFPPFSVDEIVFKDTIEAVISKHEEQILSVKHESPGERILDHAGLSALLTGDLRVKLQDFKDLSFFIRLDYVDPVEVAA